MNPPNQRATKNSTAYVDLLSRCVLALIHGHALSDVPPDQRSSTNLLLFHLRCEPRTQVIVLDLHGVSSRLNPSEFFAHALQVQHEDAKCNEKHVAPFLGCAYNGRGGTTMKTLLQGKTIKAVFVSDGESTLRFECSDGSSVLWKTDGDCCSESWFADITGFAALAGGTVAGVDRVEMPEPADGRSRQEVDSAYGYTVTTEKGQASIVFRNSSNGYYGGDMKEMTEEPQGCKWSEITDDWSA
jgi:hypothetical protein